MLSRNLSTSDLKFRWLQYNVKLTINLQEIYLYKRLLYEIFSNLSENPLTRQASHPLLYPSSVKKKGIEIHLARELYQQRLKTLRFDFFQRGGSFQQVAISGVKDLPFHLVTKLLAAGSFEYMSWKYWLMCSSILCILLRGSFLVILLLA